MGICDTATGKIRALNSIYRDQSVFTGQALPNPTGPDSLIGGCVDAAGFTAGRAGNSGQIPWQMITDPNAALGYDTSAYLEASDYQLNDQGGLQNHSVEVDFGSRPGAIWSMPIPATSCRTSSPIACRNGR